MFEKTTFFRAYSDFNSIPKSSAEIAFTGRSNVGKSSVINALCSQKQLARTSKTPGRTRSINIYEPSIGKWLVDLPGYGFAKVNKEQKAIWGQMIEGYIIGRDCPKLIFIIIDAFVGPSHLDFDMANWLKQYEVNFMIVANKCDKIPREIDISDITICNVVKEKTALAFDIDANYIFPVSAKKQQGFGALKIEIEKFFRKKEI
jgi:GTP-binding protein